MARILAGGFTAYTEDTTQTKSVTSPIGTPNISATAITLPPGEDAKNFVRADIFNLSFSASSVVDADGLATSAFWTYGDTQVNWTIEYRADSDSAWATDTSDAHTLPFEVGTSDGAKHLVAFAFGQRFCPAITEIKIEARVLPAANGI